MSNKIYKILFVLMSINSLFAMEAPRKRKDVVTEQSYDTEPDEAIVSPKKSKQRVVQRFPTIQVISNSTDLPALIVHKQKNLPSYSILNSIKNLDSILNTSITLNHNIIVAVKGRIFEITFDDTKDTVIVRAYNGQRHAPYIVIKKVPLSQSRKIGIEIADVVGLDPISIRFMD